MDLNTSMLLTIGRSAIYRPSFRDRLEKGLEVLSWVNIHCQVYDSQVCGELEAAWYPATSTMAEIETLADIQACMKTMMNT